MNANFLTPGFALLLFNALPTATLSFPTAPQTPSLPPYLERGNTVDERYRAYTKRLASLHEALRAQLLQGLPDLVNKLHSEPPQPFVYGDQILPKFVPEKDSLKTTSGPTSTAYSWNRTEKLLDQEVTRFSAVEERLQKLPTRAVAERRSSDATADGLHQPQSKALHTDSIPRGGPCTSPFVDDLGTTVHRHSERGICPKLQTNHRDSMTGQTR